MKKNFKRKTTIRSPDTFFKFKETNKQKLLSSSKKIKDISGKQAVANKKQETDHNTTTAKPFQFNLGIKSKPDFGKNINAIFRIVHSVRNTNDGASIRTVSVKIILKSMHNLYYEKAANMKDSKVIENQTMVEYLYDSFVHKYGIGKLAEKKVKEILVTVKSQKHMPSLKLFGKFLNVHNDNNYSVDDLKFFFFINREMVATEVVEARPHFKKDTNFEAEYYNAIQVFDEIPTIFEGVCSKERLVSEVQDFKTLVYANTDMRSEEGSECEYDLDVKAEI